MLRGAGLSAAQIAQIIERNALSTTPNQGLSEDQKINAENNLYPQYAWAAKPSAATSTASIRINDIYPVPLLFTPDGEHWIPQNPLASRNVYVYSFRDNLAVSSDGNFSVINNGAGAAVALPTSAPPSGSIWPGVIEASTGTTATGRSGIGQGVATAATLSQMYDVAQGDLETTHSFSIPILSTVAERFVVAPGYRNSSNLANITNGAYFTYSDNSNSGKFLCNTVANGVAATPVDSGITVVADTAYKLMVKISSARARFYINGALVVTISTNIPSGASQKTASMCMIEKSVGITPRSILLDMHESIQFLINPRT